MDMYPDVLEEHGVRHPARRLHHPGRLPWRGLLTLAALASACSMPESEGARVLDITAVDYAFQAPDTIRPGPTALRFTNQGRMPHEVILMELRDGVSVAELFAARQQDESFRPRITGGVAVLFARPGATGDGRIVVDFEAGRDYALWCDFKDGEDAPPHSTMGMFKQIHVAGARPAAGPAPIRTVVVEADDYAFRVSDTLPAGMTDFVLKNSGKQRHEASFGRLSPGVSPATFFQEYLKGSDVDSLYDDDGAILTAYDGDVNDFAVRIDLLPGRSYVLICELRDAPDAPEHARMGMFKGIEVR